MGDLGDDLVCCDSDQVGALVNNLVLAEAIFGRCQTCLANMLRAICEFSCGIDQSRYLNTTVDTIEVYVDFEPVMAEVVVSVEMNIDELFVNKTYDSCRGVINPATGTTSMDIACGQYDSKTCTPRRYF